MGELCRSKWPKCLLGYGEVAGIHVGGCVDGPRHFRGRRAHAHNWGGIHFGWICLRDEDHLGDRRLMLHELAHILTPFERHTKAFYAKVAELNGGTLPDKDAEDWSCDLLASFMRRITREGSKPGREKYFGLRNAFLRMADAKCKDAWIEAKKAWRREAERLYAMEKYSIISRRNSPGIFSRK